MEAEVGRLAGAKLAFTVGGRDKIQEVHRCMR